MDLFGTIIIILYFVGLVGIGVLASKKIKNSADFLVAGRNLGFWTFTLLVVSSICSGMTILGVAGLGYATGWPSIWEQIFVPLCAAVCILFFGTKIHAVAAKTGYVTVQDYFAHRFYSPKGIRGTSAIIGILISIIYLVGQYISISMVLSWLFDIPYQWALIIGAVIVMAYTILGGLYAVGMASLVQGIMILAGVLLVGPAVIAAAGGLEHINLVLAGIDANMTHLWYPQVHPPYAKYAFLTPQYLFSFFFLLAFGLAAAPHVVNNVLAAKDNKYFKWSPLAAFVIYAVIMYLCKITGFAARSMVAENMIISAHQCQQSCRLQLHRGLGVCLPGHLRAHCGRNRALGGHVHHRPAHADHRKLCELGCLQAVHQPECLGEVHHPSEPGGHWPFHCHHPLSGLVQSAGAFGLADLDGNRSDAGLLCDAPICRAVLEAGHP